MADTAASLPDRDPRAAVEAMLTAMHSSASAAPLKLPSTDGVFPAAAIVQPGRLLGIRAFSVPTSATGAEMAVAQR